MNQRQARMMLKLAAGLRQVPAEKLDMSIYCHGELDVASKEFNCGFSGCALGWAPRFIPEAELVLYSAPQGDTPFGTVIHKPTGEERISAACEVFGILSNEAEYLFTPHYEDDDDSVWSQDDWGNSPEDVACRLENFVRTYSGD